MSNNVLSKRVIFGVTKIGRWPIGTTCVVSCVPLMTSLSNTPPLIFMGWLLYWSLWALTCRQFDRVATSCRHYPPPAIMGSAANDFSLLKLKAAAVSLWPWCIHLSKTNIWYWSIKIHSSNRLNAYKIQSQKAWSIGTDSLKELQEISFQHEGWCCWTVLMIHAESRKL